MLIIINSGIQVTNYSPSDDELYHWRKLGEKISTRFLCNKKPMLLTPKDAMSDCVARSAYPYIHGEPFLPPINNLVDWIKDQTTPVVITLNHEEANQLAKKLWTEITYLEEIDIPPFEANEAIVINFPYVTVVRA